MNDKQAKKLRRALKDTNKDLDLVKYNDKEIIKKHVFFKKGKPELVELKQIHRTLDPNCFRAVYKVAKRAIRIMKRGY